MEDICQVVRLDPLKSEHIEAAVLLHQELLKGSLPVQFGDRFMTDFYFTKMISSGFLVCDLLYYDKKYIACNVYTKYPFSFIKKGIMRHFFYVAWLMLCEIIRQPSRLRNIVKLLKTKRWSSQACQLSLTGQWLTIAVLKRFRKIKGPGEKSVTAILFEAMVEYFRENNYKNIIGAVKKKNLEAVFSFNALGCVMEDSPLVSDEEYLMTKEV